MYWLTIKEIRMKEIEFMKKEIEDVERETHSFAYEMMQDKKYTIKLLVRIIIAQVVAMVLIVAGFLFYMQDFEYSYDTITQEQENTENSYMSGEIN